MLIELYQESWAEDFDCIKDALRMQLHGVKIEHVGSTSVKGLPAKPIIDIDVVYDDLEKFSSIKIGLESLGYYHNGDQGIEGREVFKRTGELNHEVLDQLSHHLYVCHQDSEELQRHILFRNHLRKNEEARNQYTNIKLALADRAKQDKKIYASLKEKEAAGFIHECIKKEGIENGK